MCVWGGEAVVWELKLSKLSDNYIHNLCHITKVGIQEMHMQMEKQMALFDISTRHVKFSP